MSWKSALGVLVEAASSARRRLFALTCALMLFGALAELATIGAVLPFLALVTDPELARGYPIIGRLLDRGGGHADVILLSAALLIAIAVAAGLVRLVLTWTTFRFALLYGHDVGRLIFARMLRQPYEEVVMRNSSVTLASMDKLNVVIFNLLIPAMTGVTAAVISIFITILLFLIDPFAATIAGATLVGSYLAITLVTRRRLARNSETIGTTTTSRIKLLQEGFGGIRDILIDNSQPVFEANFAAIDYRNRSALVTNSMIANAPRYLIETSVVVLIAVLTVRFAAQPGGLVAAIPVLGALAMGAQRLIPQLNLAYNGWTAFAGYNRLLIDIAELLRIPVLSTVEAPAGRQVAPLDRAIEIDKLTFRYGGREDALRDVSLCIAKGERIGFVGKTGSGKSTLIDLLMGLLPPTEGEIRIDGVPLTPENRVSWQAQIAHVPQSIYLSDGTIASNIAFGVAPADIDLERVREVATQADIDTFIMNLPEGYETSVGERGVRLSGGQRQRIGIARALYKGARVLVFDEATSALDEATERAIMASIYRLDREVTLLMIAHRLSTLDRCDCIVYLDKGKVSKIVDKAHPRDEQ